MLVLRLMPDLRSSSLNCSDPMEFVDRQLSRKLVASTNRVGTVKLISRYVHMYMNDNRYIPLYHCMY
jgi:hypothetical protein